ncbi:hypothetical protein FRX31_008295 [Thalictrum thalictroides]|uniref:Uncharacterized protein n=1 Tax=Thalictrum thalictroides TaxID=46969 RepID=A0A7J6WZU9_THATH|nr:hypothetical protein FRX31_008295 [Thalictrum thalictroides]
MILNKHGPSSSGPLNQVAGRVLELHSLSESECYAAIATEHRLRNGKISEVVTGEKAITDLL